MTNSLAFILGLLDHCDPACVSGEDFAGPHGSALRLCQRKGFLAKEPGRHPVPSCPHCREGVPLLLGGRYLCAVCESPVDARHFQLWRFDLGAFLTWLARSLHLQGDVRQVEERFWQLGTFLDGQERFECFFRRSGVLSERACHRLHAYRNVLVLGASAAEPVTGFQGSCFSLLDILRLDQRSVCVVDLRSLLHHSGHVRFDERSGTLFVGEVRLGDVPVGSKEFFLLAFLSANIDLYVSYADIKHYVLQRSGSRDTTEEATFCQRLKSRIKKRMPQIDLLLATTNKGDGYRLRGLVSATPPR
jgi:hypothetical protein